MTTDDREDFLRRWSRRKREAAAEQTPANADGQPKARTETAPPPAGDRERAPAPPPPVQSLTPQSDFRAYMDAAVDPQTRNAALKRLFTDPRFNVIDPLDIDIDDYSKLERLPEAVVKTLAHARSTLLEPGEGRAGEDRSASTAPEREEDDVAQRAQAAQEPLREAARTDAADPGAEESGTGEARDRDGNKG